MVAGRGRLVGNSVLNRKAVQEIRSLYERGHRQTELASMFGISQATVSQVVRRVTWK